MCFFLAGAGLSGALSAIGTAVSAIGSIASGVQQQKVANYNAEVAENNAVAERQRASYEADMIRDDRKRVIGAQRASGAAAGLDISTGTPVAVLGDTYAQSEMDVLARLYGGESAATAYQNDAKRFRAEGKAAKTAGIIGAGSTLLTGLGNWSQKTNPYGAGKRQRFSGGLY